MNAGYPAELLEFIYTLRSEGVVLASDGKEMTCRGPREALTPARLSTLKENKKHVLHLLEEERCALQEDIPQLTPDAPGRFLPFPLTDNQQAYWIGRGDSLDYGQVGIHAYIELAVPHLDVAHLEHCLNILVQRHDMLHAVVVGDGMQKILEDHPPITVKYTDASTLSRQEADQIQDAIRQDFSCRCYALETWPQCAYHAVRLPEGTDVLFISQDTWSLDGQSYRVLMEELAALYHGHPLPPAPNLTFRDYVLAMQDFNTSPTYQNSLWYWRRKVATLPTCPILPTKAKRGYRADNQCATSTTPQCTLEFSRQETCLSEHELAPLRASLKEKGITLAAFLLTCYAETLGHWAEDTAFTINVPWGNRLPVHADVESCVGEFASMTLIQFDSTAGGNILERSRVVMEQLLEDLQHSHVSGITLLREWRQANGLGPEACMPFVFTSETDTGDGASSSWMEPLERIGRIRRSLSQTPQVWIDAQYAVVHGELRLSWDILTGIFPEGLAERMFDAFSTLVRACASDEAIWHEQFPVSALNLPIPYSSASGAQRSVPDIDIAAVVEDWAATQAGRPCIQDTHGTLLWDAIPEKFHMLSDSLRKGGLRDGDGIAILLDKSRWQSLIPFAAKHAGGVCIPLDVESPAERLAAIVLRCGAAMVVTDTSLYSKAKTFGLPIFNVDSGTWSTKSLWPTQRRTWDADTFCIIHTSGSTGIPKGVELPFPGILNVRDHMKDLGLGTDDVVLALSPLQHDMSIPEYMGNMLCGMCAVYPTPNLRKDPQHWFELIKAHRITFWHTVPAMLTMLVDFCRGLPEKEVTRVLSSLRTICLGGDWTPLETARTLLKWVPNARIVSVGGPTEITVWNVTHTVTHVEDGWTSLPYGTPIANCGCTVVDTAGNPRPRGVVGEMSCTGAFMSPGYFNDAQLTKQAFPLCPQTGKRQFRTGDMVRMHDDGVLEFVGRKDNRVKIGGYRIELSEVELHIQTFPSVEQTVVLTQTGPAGTPVMVAWVTGYRECDININELKTHLLQTLPSYMVPAFIGVCPAFPVTTNGKVDRKAIREWLLPQSAENIRLDTPLRATLAKTWEDVLGRKPESETSNFFEYGGDSITAIRLLNKLMSAGLPHLSIMKVFQNPSFAALADYLGEISANSDADTLPSLKEAAATSPQQSGTHPASHAQQRIRVDEMIQPVPGLYNLPFRFKLHGEINTNRIIAAFQTAVNANPALRTVFIEMPEADGITLHQQVLPSIDVPFDILDFQQMTPGSAAAEWMAIATQKGAQPLSMMEGPLIRGFLALMPSQNGTAQTAELLLVVHHAVFDGWSMKLFLEQWQQAMTKTEVQPTPYSYGDFTRWERLPKVAEAMKHHTAAYSAALREIDAQPAGFHSSLASTEEHLHGTRGRQCFHRHTMPRALSERVRRTAVQQKVTPFIFLLASFGLLTSRHTGSERIILGTYSAQRFLPDLENIVGMLVNPQPLAFNFEGAHNFQDILNAAHKGLMLAKKHELAPFELLVRDLDASTDSSGQALFTITFSQDNTDKTPISAGDVTLSIDAGGDHKSSMDMEVALHEADNSFGFVVIFNDAVIARPHVEALFARLDHIVSQFTHDPMLPLSDVRYCLEHETTLLDAINNDANAPLHHASLWAWFVETARQHPHQIATMEHADGVRREYSYLDIYARAISISEAMEEALPALGDDSSPLHPHVMALFMSRGTELAAAMLAAWRLGIAAMPISTTLPAQRARAILKHSAPSILVAGRTDDATHLCSPPDNTFSGPILATEQCPHRQLKESALTAEQPRDTTAHTAWVIFTSGSTGKPKGVALSHAGLIGRLEWGAQKMPPLHGEKGGSKTDMAFGDCLCEIFGPLLYGFPVYFMEEKHIAHVDTLYETIKTEKITRLVAVPSLLREFVGIARQRNESLTSLKYVVSSGEALPALLADEVQNMCPSAKVYNFYGSTEITCDAAWHHFSPSTPKTAAIPAGNPIAGGRIQLMDQAQAVLPPTMRGQICIRGRMVCQGYLQEDGNISKTNAFFTHNGEPAFNTGDMGIWLKGGELLCLGRTDRQIKIRGQKIAPQEVEAQLLAAGGIQQASVLCIDDNGNDSLVACLATGPGNMPHGYNTPKMEILPPALRRHLKDKLPPAFIPRYTLWMEDMPRIHTGKVDHTALCTMCKEGLTLLVEQTSQQPSALDDGPARALRDWWVDMFHVHPASDSNFFHDGGSSLLAVRLIHFLQQEFDISMNVRQIYNAVTFSGLLQAITDIQCNDEEWEEI